MQLLFRYYLKFFSKYVIISDTPYPKFSRKAVLAMSGEYERSDNSVNENNYTEFTVKRSPGALRIIAKIVLVILYIGVVVGMWFILWWLGAISLLVAAALCLLRRTHLRPQKNIQKPRCTISEKAAGRRRTYTAPFSKTKREKI